MPQIASKGRLRLTKIFLKFRIELHIRRVVEKEIQLNVFVSWSFKKRGVQCVRLRRNAVWIAYAMSVLPSGALQRQNISSKHISIFRSWFSPIFPDRTPGIAESFFVRISVLCTRSL